jgi:nucleotide-binding universal stress UspA family protein
VVGVDASPATQAALAWAVAETTVRPNPVHLVHELRSAFDPALGHRARRQATDEGLTLLTQAEKVVRELGATVDVETFLDVDTAASGLLERSHPADLLVVGHRAWAGAERLMHTSVAAKVSSQAASPVVVVRNAESPQAQRVVVGIEPAGTSTGALRLAFTEAELRRAPLVAVHAHLPDISVGGGDGVSPIFDDQAVVERLERLLHDELAGWHAEYPTVDADLVIRQGSAGRVLAEASADAALLVVGSHGGRALSRRLLGSVSLAAIRHARCPVAVVRP